jgi:hypothetical protein
LVGEVPDRNEKVLPLLLWRRPVTKADNRQDTDEITHGTQQLQVEKKNFHKKSQKNPRPSGLDIYCEAKLRPYSHQ